MREEYYTWAIERVIIDSLLVREVQEGGKDSPRPKLCSPDTPWVAVGELMETETATGKRVSVSRREMVLRYASLGKGMELWA